MLLLCLHPNDVSSGGLLIQSIRSGGKRQWVGIRHCATVVAITIGTVIGGVSVSAGVTAAITILIVAWIRVIITVTIGLVCAIISVWLRIMIICDR